MATVSTPLKRRLLRGIAATALGPVFTSAIQLGSVPLLLHAWGPAKYGDWLLLSAVPSYLSFSGLGFGDSSGSDMTMRVAAGDREGALETFQSSWLLVTCISLAVLMLAVPVVWLVPWQQILHLSDITDRAASRVILALTCWVLIGQQSQVIESGYRCDGDFALGNLCGSLQRLIEAVGGTIIGVVTGNILLMALSYASVRLAGVIAYRLLLKTKRPWIKLGIGHASFAAVHRMLKPSFAFVVMPIANAVSIQGFTILVGIVIGPLGVTAFSTARTLTRVGTQLINALSNGIWPEFSSAFGSGNISRARILHRHAYQASLILSVGCAVILWILGPLFYRWWVGRALLLDEASFHVLLVVTIANSLWYASAIVQMSTNSHSKLAFVYLMATFLALGVGYPSTYSLGLTGAALSLLLIDLIMCAFVLRSSLTQMEDTPARFLYAVLGTWPFFMRPLLTGRRR